MKRAFEEYAKGTHTYKSLSHFMADLSKTKPDGTPLAKASIKNFLSNRAYIGMTHHKGEWFDGSFEPIVPPQLFEAVQKMLAKKARPQNCRAKHNFPLTNLFRCGECASMLTAQFAKGNGGVYRYYRCTKKRGTCSQSYIQEKDLVNQVQDRLQTISLCDRYTDWMLKEIDKWERNETSASQSEVQNLATDIKASEARLEKLVSAYLDGDIPKEIYLKKKDETMRATLALRAKMKDFERGGNNWVEPLREWVLDTKQAAFLSSSTDLKEIRSFVQKIGTNHTVRDKTAHFSVPVPSQFVAKRRAFLPSRAPAARGLSTLSAREVFLVGVTLLRPPTTDYGRGKLDSVVRDVGIGPTTSPM